MAEIVNLRMARKRKVRAGQEAHASEQRALHGRSKVEKQHDRAVEEKNRTFIDGHFRGKPGAER
ncbi:MAG: DUF4169 family protein [Hyphomicrobiales bacterium]|nr:DUF4169 family protein [Hyphomicrobiales bacterium]